MLIKLPNNQYVNPQAVEAVMVLEDESTVRVALEPDRWFDIPAGLDAPRLRDQIAEQINAACYEARRERT